MFTNEKSANKIKGFPGKKDENHVPVSVMERISGRKEECPACHHSHVTFHCCLRRAGPAPYLGITLSWSWCHGCGLSGPEGMKAG